MKRSFVKRAAVVMLMLAGLAALTVCRQTDDPGTVHANSPASAQNPDVRHSRTFSQAYEVCAEDSEARPLVVHRKKLVFFLAPSSPPEVNDRTFIETEECRYSAF